MQGAHILTINHTKRVTTICSGAKLKDRPYAYEILGVHPVSHTYGVCIEIAYIWYMEIILACSIGGGLGPL